MVRRKVVLTGASGYIAQRMLAELEARYDLVLLDARPTTRNGKTVPGLRVVDLTHPNRDGYRRHFAGADAVVHCAFVSAPGLDATTFLDNSESKFRPEYANVGMAYNVYRTALEESVRRVVVASSNRAADFYERLIWADTWDHVTPEMLPLSDNFYGWARAAIELLGFVLATGQGLPRRLEMVQIRIGGPRDTADLEQCRPGEIKKMHRGLGAYLSRRDQAQLFIQSIETPNVENEHGVPFQVFYGISGNTHRFWSNTNARRVIGYAPEDDSQVRFAKRIVELAHTG